MNQPCPKCGSKNTYEIGRDCGCRMCGKQFPREGVTPIVVTKVMHERKKDMPEEIKKTSSGKTGPCVNCGRTKFICNKIGQCNACRDAVKDLEPGTAAYTAALASAKERLSIGNVGRAPRARRDEKPSPRIKTIKPVEEKNNHKRPKIITSPNTDIVAVLEARRQVLMDEVFDINKAIELMKKYKKAA